MLTLVFNFHLFLMKKLVLVIKALEDQETPTVKTGTRCIIDLNNR